MSYRGWMFAGAYIAALAGGSVAQAKSPGQWICYNDICHRVATIAETLAARGRVDVVRASFYDDPAVDRFNPRRETSSGVMLDADSPDNAASPLWPDGTVLLVRVPESGLSAVIRINNAGGRSSSLCRTRGLVSRLSRTVL